MHFSFCPNVYTFSEEHGVAVDETQGCEIALEAYGAPSRLHIALLDDEGRLTKNAQGADLTVAEMRLLGNALLAAADYVEAKNGA